jgi:hypothetical protein
MRANLHRGLGLQAGDGHGGTDRGEPTEIRGRLFPSAARNAMQQHAVGTLFEEKERPSTAARSGALAAC